MRLRQGLAIGATAIAAGDPGAGCIAASVTITAPTPSPGDNSTKMATTAFVATAVAGGGGGVLRGYIDGLVLSTAGASASFGIAAGAAADSTNAVMMALVAAITKTTGAWAVGSGSGSLDTGAIAVSTWYHVHLIRRTDTGVVDVLISLSATAPTLPSPYTQFRRIGSMKTNASSQWTKFIQTDDRFMWDVPVVDVNATNVGTAAVLRALTVPTGIAVLAHLAVFFGGANMGPTTPQAFLSAIQRRPILRPPAIFLMQGFT